MPFDVDLVFSLVLLVAVFLFLGFVLRKSNSQMSNAKDNMELSLDIMNKQLAAQQETAATLKQIKTLLEDRKS